VLMDSALRIMSGRLFQAVGPANAKARLRLLSKIIFTHRSHIIFTPPPIGERRIVMSMSVCQCVCVCVCLSMIHDHIFGTTRPIVTKFFVPVTFRSGAVLLWQRSDMLCTSGFMDDVIFSHKPRLLDIAAQLKRSAHAALGLAINCAR